jgi:hypothetical protein
MAQTKTPAVEKLSRLDLSVNDVADIANARPGVCGCFALQGGGTEEAYYFGPKTALVLDVSVVHTSQVSGTSAGLGLATFLAGPRYAFRNRSRYTPYVQGQLGGVIGFDALFPGQSGTTADSVAWALGGGMEMKYNRRISFRVLEASFLNTRLPNNATSTQNNLKLSTGIVFHLK